MNPTTILHPRRTRRARRAQRARLLAHRDRLEARIGAHRSPLVRLTADTKRMTTHLERLHRVTEELAWQLRLRRERDAARAALDELVDAAWARYGWERPA